MGANYSVDGLDAEGLHYRRAQVLGFEGAPIVQLAYVTETGVPVALCVLRGDGAEDAAVVTTERHGMPAAQWANNGREYLLVGRMDAKALARVAEDFAKRL